MAASLLVLLGMAAAAEVREVGAYDEARVEAGFAVTVAATGLEPGTVLLDCDHPDLAVSVRKGVLQVIRDSDAPLPPGCALTLHADDVRSLVVDGEVPEPTSIVVQPGASHRLERLVARDVDLAVDGVGTLIVRELRADRLRLAVDAADVRFTKLAAGALDVTAGGEARVLVSAGEIGELDVAATGRARLSLDGAAATARVVARRDAVVDAGPLLVDEATLRASGRAEVWMVVTGHADVRAGGRALVGIPGEPESLQARVSGRARVQ